MSLEESRRFQAARCRCSALFQTSARSTSSARKQSDRGRGPTSSESASGGSTMPTGASTTQSFTRLVDFLNQLQPVDRLSCEPIPGIATDTLPTCARTCAAKMIIFYEYLLNWMAYAVQRRGKPGEVAVVPRGKEGCRQRETAKQFGRYRGPFRQVVQAKHLTGHFNAHLQQCLASFADEVFFRAIVRTRARSRL